MKVIFIADAHLKGLDDLNQKRLCTFLDGLGPLDKLVILGDLFEFWSGIKGVVYYHYFPVLAGLFTLREKGTDIIYVEGNHDFSMGPFFTDVLGAEVHAEPFEFLLDGKRFLLAHGDTVDSSIGHAIWRDFIRRFLQMVLTRTLTAAAVRRFALFLSKSSRAYNEARGKSIERRQRAFARRCIASGLDGVIMGHSHLKGLHEEDVEGSKGLFINPGSWMDSSYLVYGGGEFRLERYGVDG